MPADKIREAAQQLVSEWVPAARDWYLRSLLPAIEADPSLARDHERAALSDIRRFGPSSDLASLTAEAMPPSPVDETTRVRFEMLTDKLRLLIAQNRCDRAADLYERFTGAGSVGSLDELLRFVKAGRTIQKLREQAVEALTGR